MPARISGSSFTLRLLALVVIPLLGLGLLTVDRIDDQHARADAARAVVDQARVQQSVAAVYGPAQMEQIALEGLATIDELRVPRELVVTLAGVDFESMYNSNAIELDRALDRLAAQHGQLTVTGTDGSPDSLGNVLSFVRGRVAGQRLLSTEMQAQQTGIREVFSQLDRLLADALGGATASSTTLSGGEEAGALLALGDLHAHAGNRGIALLNGLLNRSDASVAAIVAAEARFELAVESFERLLDPMQAAELNALLDRLVPVPEALVTSSDESIAVQMDPGYIEDSASAILDQLAFLAALEQYSNAFHSEVVNTLEARADSARSAALDTTLLFGAIALVSLLFVLAIALSTLRPLRRLTVRAAAISAGSFDAPPLPTSGPRDVRTLTRSMNEMMGTLRTVDRQLSGLADGQPSTATTSIPGDIGESLRRSFERLADTTARLHASEQLASAIVEQAVDAIWTVDAHGLIRSANEASARLLGVADADQIGLPLRQFLSTTDGEAAIETADGETTRLLVRSNPIDSGDEALSTVIAHDISERLRYEERLAYQAHHDALTGLPNRFAVLERLGTVAPGRPVAVLFVDLDGFKSVNDTQGHVAGDRVLTEVADRLSSSVRPGDFVGRLGGDEFVIVMQDYARDSDVVAFARRLICDVEQPHGNGDNLFMLSASIGVATYSNGLGAERITPLEAIRQADNAVYAAKRRGRGRVELFDAALQASIVRAAEIEIALRHAVRNDELELHLQPVLDVRSGVFCGAEALVRWNRDGVVVPPNDFIPIAERSSLIFEIGRWVLGRSCETLARWREEDPETQRTIAVNIAGSHLIDGNLLDDLDAALLSTGADPALLEFELTETQLMDDFERATAVLHEVRARGIRVAIDDFGTGYSSMAYLRELPIDTLKIDRSFVASVIEDSFDSTVIDALLTIGHALGLSVVAEGIEHEEQLEYLSNRGCDRAQGFLLARPMPVDDAEHVLFARSPSPARG